MEDYFEISNKIIDFLSKKAGNIGKDYTTWCSVGSILDDIGCPKSDLDLKNICDALKSNVKICLINECENDIDSLNIKLKKIRTNEQVLDEVIIYLGKNKKDEYTTFNVLHKIGISKGNDVTEDEFEKLENYLVNSKFLEIKEKTVMRKLKKYLQIKKNNFFGYNFGDRFAPPAEKYPNYYYNYNLKPKGKFKFEKGIKIDIRTSGYPDFLISNISASSIQENEKEHNHIIEMIFSDLDESFFIHEFPEIGKIRRFYFDNKMYKGELWFDTSPNIGFDNGFYFQFHITDKNVESKHLF